MHWGYRIAALYLGFVVFIISLVTLAMRQHFDLVASDYYQQEMKYQEVIDKKENLKALSQPISVRTQKNNQIVLFTFPPEIKNPKGEIYFYRSADSRKDFSQPVFIDQNHTQAINYSGLEKGIWKIKLDFSDADKPYYQEFNVYLL